MRNIVLLIILLAAALTAAGCHRHGSGVSESRELEQAAGGPGAATVADPGDISNNSRLGNVGSSDSVYRGNGIQQQKDTGSDSDFVNILPGDNSVSGDGGHAIREVHIDCDNFYCGNWPDDFPLHSGWSESYARHDIAVPKDQGDLTSQEAAYVKRLRFINIVKWVVVSGGVLVIIILMVYRNNKWLFNRLYNRFEANISKYAGADGKLSTGEVLTFVKDVITGKVK